MADILVGHIGTVLPDDDYDEPGKSMEVWLVLALCCLDKMLLS